MEPEKVKKFLNSWQRGYEQNNRLIAFWVAFWDIFCLAFWVAFSEHFMMSTPAAYGGLRTSPHITTTYHTPPSAEQCFPYCWTSVWYRRFQWIPVVAIQVTQGRTVVKLYTETNWRLEKWRRLYKYGGLAGLWTLTETFLLAGWFERDDSANELGSVISVSCLNVYLGKTPSHQS